jgi:hypothetical protein
MRTYRLFLIDPRSRQVEEELPFKPKTMPPQSSSPNTGAKVVRRNFGLPING